MDENNQVQEPEQGIQIGDFNFMGSLPGGVQVLIDWVILVISTLVSFFMKKKGGDTAEG